MWGNEKVTRTESGQFGQTRPARLARFWWLPPFAVHHSLVILISSLDVIHFLPKLLLL
jgi:hypothetical protein